MRKFLVLFLLTASVMHSAQESIQKKFLRAYYLGQYEKAHEMLRQAASEEIERKVWDERIHYHDEGIACDHDVTQKDPASGLALLRIGSITEAQERFDQGWISLYGKATLSSWQNDLESSRKYIQEALQLNPDQPELLLAAADFARTEDEAVEYFGKYLRSDPRNLFQKASAQSSLDFIRKTRQIEVNQMSLEGENQSVDSNYDHGRLIIRASVNGKNLKLLVDTGAAGLSLSGKNLAPNYITNLLMVGLGKNQIRGRLAVFDKIQFGELEIQNVVAALNPSFKGKGIDGVIGSILFKDYTILLPMRDGIPLMLFRQDADDVIPVLKEKGFEFEKQITFPFYKVNKMIILKGKIKKSDEEMDILLDTGAQQSVLSAATAKRYVQIDYNRTRNRRVRQNLFGIGGKIEDLLYANNGEVQIGPLKETFNKMVAVNLGDISEAMQLEVDLILGQDFLKDYCLLVDYKNNQVTFLK